MASPWDSFLSTIEGVGKKALGAVLGGFNTGVSGGATTIAQQVASAGVGIAAPQFTNGLSSATQTQLEQQLRTTLQKKLAENKSWDAALMQKSNDLILKTAVKLNDNVISPYITRPISTAALLTDPTSPLYKSDEYGQGFQVSDISRAYARSEFVSPAQALTKSKLVPGLDRISSVVLSAGGIDLEHVNLWKDEDVKKNFSDNVVGRWYTGFGDFTVGNVALGLAGKAVGFGAKAAVEAAGMGTSKTVSEIEKMAREGFLYADTNGQQGTLHTVAAHMQELADTTNIKTIEQIVSKYSTNDSLIPILHDVTSREAALDVILADKGNIDAMIRLTKTNPDHLFELADVPAQIRSRNLLTGELYQPTGPAAQRIKDAWESAIARDERFAELRSAFLDDSYNPIMGGRTNYVPGTPKYFKEQYVKTEAAIRDFKSEAAYRDFQNFGHIAELKFGSRVGGIAVNFVKFVNKGAGYKPLGFVTNSGMRPMDAQIELRAFLDDIKLFGDGSRDIYITPNQTEKVVNIRKAFDKRLAMAKTDVEMVKTLEEIDQQIGNLIAYNNGHFEQSVIDAQYASMRAHMRKQMESFQQNGYSVNFDGSINTSNADTLRQMAESYRFTPWNHMEREFDKMSQEVFAAAGGQAKATIKSLYEDLTRIWTFDVLARPSFIIKQSFAEPVVSVFLSQGTQVAWDAVKTFTGRGLVNARNAVMKKASLTLNKGELEAVNSAVSSLQQSASKAIAIKDMLQVEYENLVSTGSPILKDQYLDIVRKDLKAANRLVDDLELELNAATTPFGVKETIPSLATLERRIAWIEQNVTGAEKARIASRIANAKAAVGQYKGTINSMASNVNVIKAADNALAKAYMDIEEELDLLGMAQKNQADLFGRTARFKKQYTGKTSQYRMINGQWVNIDSFVNDVNGNNFVNAVRAEVSNARTTQQNFIGELAVGTRKSILQRKVPNVPVGPTHPLYYEELANVANRFIRQEPLMDLILQDTSIEELLKWGMSNEGKNYFKHFGLESENQILPRIEEKVALIKRMFPSTEARAAIYKGEVTAQELQTMLSSYSNRLYRIQPTDFEYAERAVLGNRWYANLENAIGSATSKVFKLLTSPENPIRETIFDKIAIDKVAEKAKYLMDQGVQMTPKMYNALRQSAGREAIQELEKTVYTVRRQNRMLYAARAAVAFPTATLSAFYRYGRLAIKNPERTMQFLNNYQAAFKSFGVDKNGNPTKNVDEIAYLVLPGSRDIPFLKGNGDGILLNARSIGFMLNLPSPSAISAVSAGTVMKTFPGTEDGVKKALGPLWDIWFPYGAPTSVTKSFMPPWLNAAYNAVTGPEGKADYMASVQSVYDYHKMLNELGIEKKFPAEKDIYFEAQKLWEQKARWSFMSPFGVPIKVSTNQMDLVDTLWYTLMNKYQKQGKTYQEAKDLAGNEMIQTLGPNFIVDRVSFRTSTTRFNMPETPEAWGTIFKDNTELVNSIAGIKNGDISLLGLLTGDMRVNYEDRNTAIVNKLKDPNLKLPDSSTFVNNLRKTPKEVEALRIKNRTWKEYTALKESLTKDIPEGKTLRSYPGRQEVLNNVAISIFKKQSPEWFNEYMNSQTGNSAWEYARAMQFAISDDKFMKQRAGSKYWQDIKNFMLIRTVAVAIYNSFPTGDRRKSAYRDNYLNMLDTFAASAHPELKQIISNYFDNDNLKEVA